MIDRALADCRYAQHLLFNAAREAPSRRWRIGDMGCEFLERALRPLLVERENSTEEHDD